MDVKDLIKEIQLKIQAAERQRDNIYGGDTAKSNYQIAIANMYQTLATLVIEKRKEDFK